ncbi:hypothetical protein FNJ84_07835 [Paracoccus sp. M683]|uniref:hypothetical protein n=1 Tax=Paracoccus sp. M683 TaxID=2594268 RepID=UPI0011808C6F|nr:hypothetical protein [Paracoccus sp. M683]TRW97415.1 hypothetical protein FNJ84_07835 [Paracoccus sp. M683]
MFRLFLAIFSVVTLNVTLIVATAHSGNVASAHAAAIASAIAGGGASLGEQATASCEDADDCKPEGTECAWGNSTFAAIVTALPGERPTQIAVRISNAAFIASRSGIILPPQKRPPRRIAA